jgi:hypothetical protein
LECPAGSELPVQCPGSRWIVIDPGELAVNPELMKQVRDELNQTLDEVGKLGVDVARKQGPQTRAQAEQLESELEAALKEVRELKKTLK